MKKDWFTRRRGEEGPRNRPPKPAPQKFLPPPRRDRPQRIQTPSVRIPIEQGRVFLFPCES
ncbi:MAG: hypothetical protein V4574_21375, partial [Pseudomonadota bacterium]